MGLDNHETPFYMGETANERVTKLASVALDAMKESEYYLPDDRLAVLITNHVTKSDWGTSECGMGFWNFDDPRDVINTLLNHIMAIGEGYGVGIGVVEASIETVSDPLGESIARALQSMAKEVCNCPKCKARRGEAEEPDNMLGKAIQQAMDKLLAQMEAEERRNAEGQ